MAVTNLHLAKIDGRPMVEDEIQKGVEAHFPSGMGGVMKYSCVYKDSFKAVFKPVRRRDREFTWLTQVIEFNVADLTGEEIKRLPGVLKSLTGWQSGTQTADDMALAERAVALGYFTRQSTTQWHWTEKGISMLKSLS